MKYITFVIAVLLGASATAAKLSGRIVDQQGRGVERAIVVISTARPRVGPAVTCPSCYRDCAKRSRTDSEGRFTIKGLSSKLLFSLAAGGSGYQGTVTKHFDPADDPAIELKLQSIADSPEVASAIGTVVDAEGNPVGGAEVRSRTIYRTSGRIGGSDKSVTPLTLTDDEGKFELTLGSHISRLDLRVVASGYAPNEVSFVRSGDESLEIKLGRGASIRGRLMSGDTPLAGVELGLVQRNRSMGNIVTPVEVSTDAEGFFRFDQLPPSMEYTVYTHTGQNAKGALHVSLVEAPEHGMLADLGDIPTLATHRLKLVVRTEDGSPIPAKSYVHVGRGDAWRGSTLHLDRKPKSTVMLNDVGAERFQLSVRVPNFKVVGMKPNLNKDINGRYEVAVNGDTEVEIVIRKEGELKATPPDKSVTRL